MTPQVRSVHEPGMGDIEIFPVAPDEKILFGLLEKIFAKHWHEIAAPGASFTPEGAAR